MTDFAFYAAFSAIVSTALARIMFAASGMMLASTALGRIRQVMDAPTMEITDKPRTPGDNSVEFRDVSFTYEGAELPALDHVSFSVKPGQTVSIREKSRDLMAVRDSLNKHKLSVSWLTRDEANLSGTLQSVPERSEIPENIDVQLIVELYSR